MKLPNMKEESPTVTSKKCYRKVADSTLEKSMKFLKTSAKFKKGY